MITTELISRHKDKRELPDGWRWVKLGEVAEFKNGINFTSNQKGRGILTVDVLNMYSDSVYVQMDELYRVNIQLTDEYLLQANDILFVRSSVKQEGVGWATLFPGHTETVTFCGFLIRARLITTEIHPEFLINYFRSSSVRSLLVSKSGRGTITNINQGILQELSIPLPSLDEQKRIAVILNEQMEAVERSRQATLAQLEAAKALPAAYLRAVFNSPEALKWERKPLGLVGEIASGITLGRNLNGRQTHRIPYLRVANVKDGYLDLSDVYEIEATDADIKKCRLKYGDILLTEGGDPDKLGRGTFWEEQIPACIHQNHIFRVRFDLNEFLPQFLSAQIGSPYGKAYFLTHAKRTTGIATINRQVLAGFPLMVPSIDEQKRIAITLAEQLAEVERLQQSLKSQLDAINKLPAVLLRRAFYGEL